MTSIIFATNRIRKFIDVISQIYLYIYSLHETVVRDEKKRSQSWFIDGIHLKVIFTCSCYLLGCYLSRNIKKKIEYSLTIVYKSVHLAPYWRHFSTFTNSMACYHVYFDRSFLHTGPSVISVLFFFITCVHMC